MSIVRFQSSYSWRLSVVYEWALVLFLFFLPLTVQAQDDFTYLGTLGGTESWAFDVSADGSVVVGGSNTDVDEHLHAFRWTSEGGMDDLDTWDETRSTAYGVSADGSVVVGYSYTDAVNYHAFRWTSEGGIMEDLSTLGGSKSVARGVSADGTVVAGYSDIVGDGAQHAFRWTNDGDMENLGTLGGTNSLGYGISADGTTVAGYSDIVGDGAQHAFRWTNDGDMEDLETLGETLGGTNSYAWGVSSDGSVIVGQAQIVGDAETHAFRWTSECGMDDLETLGGTESVATDVSADGSVVVGWSKIAGDAVVRRAFRWTQGTRMQSIEDWLRAAGVTVPEDITDIASAVNTDGSVVVGTLSNTEAFLARVSPIGNGLITFAEVQESLGAVNVSGSMILSSAQTLINGAHSRPLSRCVPNGKNIFWAAGDWGLDNYGLRSGDLGMSELGLGRNFGLAQFDLSIGRTWARQDFTVDGHAKTYGIYVLAEMMASVVRNLWATLSGYNNWGEADIKRGYMNAGAPDSSIGEPDVNSWGVRARLEWENALRITKVDLSPYLDFSYHEAELDAYTETGGGFPARFDRRKDKATELRLGLNLNRPINNNVRVISMLEWVHRFEEKSSCTTGEMVGLFNFNLAGQKNSQDWLHGGIGIESKLFGGQVSIMLNSATRGETPNPWLSVNWQKEF